MPVRDSTRFGRTEILNRFRAEIAARYLDLEPYYCHKNGLLGFKNSLGGDLRFYIEKMIPDAFGVPSMFYLVDDAGQEIANGNIYTVITALVECAGGEANIRSTFPEFEFVSDDLFHPGQWGKFYYDGKLFYVMFEDMSPGIDGMDYKVYVIDENGLPVGSYASLEQLKNEGIASRRKTAKDLTRRTAPPGEKPISLKPMMATVEGSKVKARRLADVAAATKASLEPIEANVRVFKHRALKEHIQECAFQYRPYRRVIKIEKMTPEEVRDHRQWLRKTKRHRKLYTKRYYKKNHLRLERNQTRRERMNIKLKPHKPGYKFTYKR